MPLAPAVPTRQPAASDPARPASPCASDQVARGIVTALETGGFAPGQRLIEADLCLRFGVGRSAVRDALQRLAAQGVVELSPNRGARISEISVASALDTLEVTELLLGLAARTAARAGADPAAMQRIRQALAQVDAVSADTDPAGFAAARKAFYGALIRAGGNQALRRIVPTVQVHVLRAQFGFNALQAQLCEDFRAIGAAVLAGNPETAERLGREHVRRIRARIEETTTRHTKE